MSSSAFEPDVSTLAVDHVIPGITQHADLDNQNAREDFGYKPMRVEDGFQHTWPV